MRCIIISNTKVCIDYFNKQTRNSMLIFKINIKQYIKQKHYINSTNIIHNILPPDRFII